jgi:NitT/TauT family transport system substrate-binding protein
MFLIISVFIAVSVIGQLKADAKAKSDLRLIRLGVGYIPNVQFAPIYVAQEKEFYAEEGLKVEPEYGFENDFVALTAKGEREFAFASGDQVILARSQDIPITYIMKWHQRYPVALVAPKTKKIRKVSDLEGKSLGIPGFFGASFIGWKALAFATGFDETKVDIKQIGFTQASAIQQDIVDSAIVYIVNEPIQLRHAGVEVDVIQVSDFIDLVSNGFIVGERLKENDPDLVKRMVRATIKGLSYSMDHLNEAFAICRQIIPEITDESAQVQMQVLKASAELWRAEKMGVSTKQSWIDSVDFMQKTGLITKPVKIDELYTNRFVE